jgi:hypothetical protein
VCITRIEVGVAPIQVGIAPIHNEVAKGHHPPHVLSEYRELRLCVTDTSDLQVWDPPEDRCNDGSTQLLLEQLVAYVCRERPMMY